MNIAQSFPYILDNLITTINPLTLIFVSIGLIVSYILMYYATIYYRGFILMMNDIMLINKRKDTLNELILMKDIQAEMEKEIEQAMLKATFQ